MTSEIMDSRPVKSGEKEKFNKNFLGIFELLVEPFLSEHFQNKLSVVEFLVR